MATVSNKLITLEEFLALPDDGKERWVINGELREGGMTRRNRFHSKTEAKISHLLLRWLETQNLPKGEIHAGEAGCILRQDPLISYGIDVAYFDAEVIARQTDLSSMIVGAPVLAVEILSPSDKKEDIDEKVDAYLQEGVEIVWLVDPHFRTVTILKANEPPVLVNETQEICGEALLPGLVVKVAEIFS